MTLEQLCEVCNDPPFRAFGLHLADGDKVDVLHRCSCGFIRREAEPFSWPGLKRR